MWGLHLKKCGDWWHYCRAIPAKFRDIEEKSLIRTCHHFMKTMTGSNALFYRDYLSF